MSITCNPKVHLFILLSCVLIQTFNLFLSSNNLPFLYHIIDGLGLPLVPHVIFTSLPSVFVIMESWFAGRDLGFQDGADSEIE